MPFYFLYVDDTLLCVPLEKLQTVINTFKDYHPRIQFTHEMERNNRISFLDLDIIKLDNGKIVSNWYRKSTYLDVGKFLFFNQYPQDLIEKHIKIKIEQVKSKQSSNVDIVTQSEIFDEHNTIVLPYIGQISKTIQFMMKKFKIHTIFKIPFGMEGLMYTINS